MKVLIIEDEKPAADKLHRYLQQYDPEMELLACLSSVEAAVDWLSGQPESADLLFMDIQLTDGLSFEIFQQVDIRRPVIFTTAFDEYAIDAFKVNSIDYILKPITFTALSNALKKLDRLREELSDAPAINKVVQRLAQQKFKDRFLVKMGNHIHSIQSSEIACFCADGRTVYLLTLEGRKYIVDYKLEELEKLLDPARFRRVNRSFIISIEAIDDIVVYSNNRLNIALKSLADMEIIVSREKVAAFKEWLKGEG